MAASGGSTLIFSSVASATSLALDVDQTVNSRYGHGAADQRCRPAETVASLIARQRRSGVAGIGTSRMPSGCNASTSALPTAGIAPTAPASPAPLTPSGLVLVGTGLLSQCIDGKSRARGIA